MLSEEDFNAWQDDGRTKAIKAWFTKEIEREKDAFASGDIPLEKISEAVQFIQARAELIAMKYADYVAAMTEPEDDATAPPKPDASRFVEGARG